MTEKTTNQEPTGPTWEEALVVADASINRLRTAGSTLIQQTLQALEGSDFGGIDGKRSFAITLRQILKNMNLQLVCPKCGLPTALRCDNEGTTGRFWFEHRSPDNKLLRHAYGERLPKLTVELL